MSAPVDTLRALCLALPETTEKEAWGEPTWRVRERIFAMMHAGAGRPAVWAKAPDGVQAMLIDADPDRFFRPPYVGHKGWVGAWLDDDPDWDHVGHLVRRSWAMTAPKRLAETLADAGG